MRSWILNVNNHPCPLILNIVTALNPIIEHLREQSCFSRPHACITNVALILKSKTSAKTSASTVKTLSDSILLEHSGLVGRFDDNYIGASHRGLTIGLHLPARLRDEPLSSPCKWTVDLGKSIKRFDRVEGEENSISLIDRQQNRQATRRRPVIASTGYEANRD